MTTKRRKKEERKKNDELRTSATSLFLSEIVPISVSSQTVFVIIARRREVEEEPSARAHLLFPLTPDRDTKSADSKRRKKRKRRYSISGSLSLSEPWWPLQNPHPFSHVPTRRQLFERKENPYCCVVVFSTLVVRGVLFFHERERERERERDLEYFFFDGLLLCSL